MICLNRGCGLIVLAVLATGVATTRAGAETLVLRNDTGNPIVLQAASVCGGVVRRDRPCTLNPRDSTRICLPGDKLITLYDAHLPSRILYQGTIPSGKEDLFFSVWLDPVSGKISLQQVKVPRR